MQNKSNLKIPSIDQLKLNKNHKCGIHSTIRRILFCSRVMGMLPLVGLNSETSENLRFIIWSPYTIYYALTIFGQVVMCMAACIFLAHDGLNMNTASYTLFYSSSLLSLLILLNIIRNWHSFVLSVEEIENALVPLNRDITKITNTVSGLILTAAVVEHIFATYFGLAVSRSCGSGGLIEDYFVSTFTWIFGYTPYALWKGLMIKVYFLHFYTLATAPIIGNYISFELYKVGTRKIKFLTTLTKIFSLQATFIWNLNDLLIMVISIHLTEHFLVHNDLLKKAVAQDHFTCTEFRTQYMKIVRLVKLVNGQFGIYLLTSFGSNLYWLSKQLFYSLKYVDEKRPRVIFYGWYIQKVYFTYSFTFLLARTLLVLFLATRIHSNSKVPLSIVYDLPSSKYDIEVERYIAQIKNIKVAMSGMEFFHVTSKMMLTLMGTMATYELFLIQFDKNKN